MKYKVKLEAILIVEADNESDAEDQAHADLIVSDADIVSVEEYKEEK